MLDEFRRTYGRSAFIEDAEAMYAISLYNMCPAPERDQSSTQQAIMAISEFISHYPESKQMPIFDEMIEDLTWRLHEKSYINAYTYYKIERYRSAIMAFRNSLKQYPTSHRREDVMYYIVMSCHEYAENSVETKQIDRYMETLDAYYTFIMEFPESKYRKDVEKVAEAAKRYIEKNKEEE
jgi:outer membrane protein assembly factor BamD